MNYFTNIYYMISHLFLMLFFYLFTVRRFSRGKTIIICFSSFLLITFTDFLKLNIFPGNNLCYTVVTIVQILIVQFTGNFISKTRDSRSLFMSLSASNYVIAGSIAASVFHIYTGNVLISLAGSFLVHFSILFLLYTKLKDIWQKSCEKEYMKNWWELCMIPVFFYAGFSFLAFFPHTLYEYPRNIPGVVIFLITMFVSYVVVLRYVESESKRAGIYWKNVMYESYIKGLEAQYCLVEQSEQNLKILRHDMRHYSNMIHSFLEQGEYEEIKKITEYIRDVADENKVVRYCSNMIVNSIISKIVENAHTFDIDVNLDIMTEGELPVNDYEFASVIANLLENAVSCVKNLDQKKRYVNAKIHCEKDHLFIHIENEYEEEIAFDNLTGLPKSKKGENHGLGMQSVSAFSDKIGGNIGCYCENGIFHIIIFAKFQDILRKKG